jgi:hypothetical protein
MVTKEELEALKIIGNSIKVKNMWIRVYDDKTGKDGLVSVSEILEGVVRTMEENKK